MTSGWSENKRLRSQRQPEGHHLPLPPMEPAGSSSWVFPSEDGVLDVQSPVPQAVGKFCVLQEVPLYSVSPFPSRMVQTSPWQVQDEVEPYSTFLLGKGCPLVLVSSEGWLNPLCLPGHELNSPHLSCRQGQRQGKRGCKGQAGNIRKVLERQTSSLNPLHPAISKVSR